MKNSIEIVNIKDLQEVFYIKRNNIKTLAQILQLIDDKIENVEGDELPFLDQQLYIKYSDEAMAIFDLLDYYSDIEDVMKIRYEFTGTVS